MSNDIDLYWLRSRLRKEIPDRLYTQYGYTYSESNNVLDGVDLVLQTLTDITGVDFLKIS